MQIGFLGSHLKLTYFQLFLFDNKKYNHAAALAHPSMGCILTVKYMGFKCVSLKQCLCGPKKAKINQMAGQCGQCCTKLLVSFLLFYSLQLNVIFPNSSSPNDFAPKSVITKGAFRQ